MLRRSISMTETTNNKEKNRTQMNKNLLKYVLSLAISMVVAIPDCRVKAEDKAPTAGGVKYVRLEKPTEFMHIAEVQVFVAGKNVATTGKAEQSSTMQPTTASSLAIDGNTDGEGGNNSITHTAAGDQQPWWELTLPGPTAIDEVVVWNRTDHCTERLANTKVLLLDGDRKLVASALIKEAEDIDTFHFKLVNGALLALEQPLTPDRPAGSREAGPTGQHAGPSSKQAPIKVANLKPGVASQALKVFILAGQSNMEGHGGLQTLDQLGNEPTTHGELLKKIKNSDGSYIVRDDVFVYYQRGDGKIAKPLTVSMGAGQGFIGPELMFGIKMGDFYNQESPSGKKTPVLLIKTCWGGRDLWYDFRPPSAGKPPYTYTKRETEMGSCYRQMVKEVHECLDNLDVNFPQFKGMKYEIRGLVWFQGWNEMFFKKAVMDEYSSNFVHLVQDLRSEFKVPNMPAVVGELGVGGENVQGDKQMIKIRAAQAKIAMEPELAGTVGYVRTAPFWYPELSELPGKLQNAEGRVRNEAAARVAVEMKGKPESSDPKKMEQLAREAGDKALKEDVEYLKIKTDHDKNISHWPCHYYGSARVYCMVGYSLAEAMKPLLTKP
jgi:hypothetical protein